MCVYAYTCQGAAYPFPGFYELKVLGSVLEQEINEISLKSLQYKTSFDLIFENIPVYNAQQYS